MGELVRYHNDMNKVSFSNFNEKELDLFFSICQQMKEKGLKEITFTFDELRKLSNYSNRSIQRLYLDLDKVYKKMLELNLKYEDENEIRRFVLFNRYILKKDEKTVTIKASEDFEYILNNLIGNFTKFDLIDFVKLKSSYSKNMFKLLKQWETKKERTFKTNELKEILGIPKGFSFGKINERVLNPIMEELPKYFSNLKLEKIKTGRSITSLKFIWSSKKQEIKEVEKIEIKISEKLNKSIQKAKKNRFIEKLLNNDNIEILVNTFDENDLIKGFIWASKEIKQDINTLNYLVKTIKTGAEKSEKKIVIKESIEEIIKFQKEEVESKIIENIESKKNIEKIKITQFEYEDLYQIYLKENNEKHNPYARKGFDIANRNKYEIIEDKKYKYTIEELRLIPLEELMGKKIEIIEETNPINKTEIQKKEDFKINMKFENITEEKLLSKNGKMLKGGALLARLQKIARENKMNIQYRNKLIEY